ncbi:unknown [Crocosphaera subtropica ATCC 51142]|uniref:Uncharacterized protein n=1 Tax=Crocosphaera subtropica (strain ATCC 51142 / BH68) TaxID=43989 RepID=B1WPQ5_CROS5|nr:unknown [Crocosphaera subtropica ATCC 51142]
MNKEKILKQILHHRIRKFIHQNRQNRTRGFCL